MIRRRNMPMEFDAGLILDPMAPLPPGIKGKKAKRLAELREAYQYALNRRFERASIRCPEDVVQLMLPLLQGLAVEQLWMLPLNSHSQVITQPSVISRGDIDGTEAGPRAILRAALLAHAAKMIMVHNHPTGIATASPADRAVTRRVVQGGRTIDLPLDDHLVIGASGAFTSLRRDDPSLFSA